MRVGAHQDDEFTGVCTAVTDGTFFSVLGPLRITAGGVAQTLRGPMVNKVMALLLLRAGQVVDVDLLVDELWEEDPPRWAVSTVRTHVYHLRRQLDTVLDVPAGRLLRTRRSGYVLDAAPERVDAERFVRSVREGRRLLAQGRPSKAAAACREGLSLWQGSALSGVYPGRVLAGHVHYLEEQRLQAHRLCVEADAQLGRHAELVPELRTLVADHPLDEWFHHSLIEALQESGRRGEALVAFRRLRTLLREELGLEPSADLRIPA